MGSRSRRFYTVRVLSEDFKRRVLSYDVMPGLPRCGCLKEAPLNLLQKQFYGKLTLEQEGFLLGERGEKKLPDTFTNRLPPLRYFTCH